MTAAEAAAARRAVVGSRPRRDRRARADAARACTRERGIAILLVEHDVELVRSFVRARVRARLRHADRVGPDRRRCSPTPRCARPTSETSSDGRRRRRARRRARRCSSCATSTPATDRSARSSACRSRSPPGGVLALLGSNGVGQDHDRPRVLRARSRRRAGEVLLRRRRRHRPARRIEFARLGIVHAPEGRSVFASLTVEENLELTFRRSRGRTGVRRRARRGLRAVPAARRAAHAARGHAVGRRAAHAVARRACSSSKPRLLIADELSLGLAPIIVDEVYRTLETIRDAGTTLLIVEQHVHHALAHRRRRDRARRRARSRTRARCRSSAICRPACSAAATPTRQPA